jgi:D-sedoheptulose 7-phosphate isomerase
MAWRFERGGRLLVFGEGAAATDAQHVSVEFVHPVLVGKRALPALSLGSDVAALSAVASSAPLGDAFAHALGVLGREADIAMGIAGPAGADAVERGLDRARRMRMLTLGLVGGEEARLAHVGADHLFVVPSRDPMLVQEVQETLYHVLWELVHVFFDHGVVA